MQAQQYLYDPSDIKCWPNLGLGLDPGTPRAFSEKDLKGKSGSPFCTL